MSAGPLPYAQLDRAPTAVHMRRSRDRVLRRTRAAHAVLEQLAGLLIVATVVLAVTLRLTGEL